MCMHELDIPLEDNELENPKHAVVRSVYEALCEICTGTAAVELSPEDHEAAKDALSFEELHEDSIPAVASFRQLVKLMHACGVYDISVWDFVRPTSERFKRNLSAIINFAKFREERMITYAEMAAASDALLEKKAQIDEENAALQARIDAIMKEREAEAPAVEELEEACRKLEADINECNKQQAVIKYDAGEIKNQINAVRDQISSMQFETLNVQEESDNLKGNIVRSPERLRRELDEEHESLEKRKERAAQLEEDCGAVERKVMAVRRANEELAVAVKAIEDVEAEMDRCKKASKDAKMQSTSIETHSSMMRELVSKHNYLERQVKAAEDKLGRLRAQKSVKLEAVKEALELAELEKEALSTENRCLSESVKENQALAKQLGQQLESQRLQHSAALLEKRQEFFALEEEAQGYNRRLLAEIASN